jgi:hypothetical protein
MADGEILCRPGTTARRARPRTSPSCVKCCAEVRHTFFQPPTSSARIQRRSSGPDRYQVAGLNRQENYSSAEIAGRINLRGGGHRPPSGERTGLHIDRSNACSASRSKTSPIACWYRLPGSGSPTIADPKMGIVLSKPAYAPVRWRRRDQSLPLRSQQSATSGLPQRRGSEPKRLPSIQRATDSTFKRCRQRCRGRSIACRRARGCGPATPSPCGQVEGMESAFFRLARFVFAAVLRIC